MTSPTQRNRETNVSAPDESTSRRCFSTDVVVMASIAAAIATAVATDPNIGVK
jgi:hypothetical protein